MFRCEFLGGCCGLGGEGTIGAQRTSQQCGEAVDIAGVGQHPHAEKALAHQAHVKGHPPRHVLLPKVLLEGGGVIATVVDLAA